MILSNITFSFKVKMIFEKVWRFIEGAKNLPQMVKFV